MSFFGVNVTNPFTSPVGQRIEQATDGSLPSENWALNMEICDIINETDEGPRDAIKAIKKRLSQAAGKNYTIVMYTLTVLETCVKNCGKRFHALACSREFVQELVKLIGPKNEPPTAVQEKILNLIQTWADTFKNQSHTQGVVQVYQELKSKGIDFPMTDLDAMAPIITPERSVPEVVDSGSAGAAAAAAAIPTTGASSTSSSAAAAVGAAMLTAGPTRRVPVQPMQLSEQQMLKLRGELDIVHGNMRVLSEMLAAHSSGVQDKAGSELVQAREDMELLTELHNTCKSMQERVVYLIGKLAHDELTAELLQINDEMNNLFLRYRRFSKNKQVPASALVAQAIGANQSMANAAAVKKKLEAGDSLIDLSDDEADAQGAAALPLNAIEKRINDLGIADSEDTMSSRRKDHEKDEFDAFAQARTASFDAAKNRRGSDDEADPSSSRAKNPTDKSVTSSEFERFLAERTAAVASEIGGGSRATTSNGASSGGGSGNSKDQEDKSLFAL
ncbi:TOM1-like protein 2 [Phymastichus coffea]|uniref:TOM1-like protein 2 n=1 Tax=Phymastichus coffea TaxID=108790 RepID=UPI00273C5941|nr:TOM1-like protein 2 [Phymastichus coffea]